MPGNQENGDCHRSKIDYIIGHYFNLDPEQYERLTRAFIRYNDPREGGVWYYDDSLWGVFVHTRDGLVDKVVSPLNLNELEQQQQKKPDSEDYGRITDRSIICFLSRVGIGDNTLQSYEEGIRSDPQYVLVQPDPEDTNSFRVRRFSVERENVNSPTFPILDSNIIKT